ncbi:HugZ family pyridoxamine 5'-phosphate oxidase [Sedimenticola selenatireducens]|uniref:HugZ family protein n=1 Tax=Sedimenticola selenatireducens TaxID=191960 RepID=A0A557S9M7_9GAMM|nr:pyridoxamine 5'-phosphate oxidase family protein [Sedimenticola selenatireducens]TVO74116.1 HugZ family protein [Sedimenticola selenatireducens]TVT61636.1 MAG: HugZ family protein [Sedimenticola selenatireducens]
MNDSENETLAAVKEAYLALIASQQTLMLSTVNAMQQAEISYAPYVQDSQGTFCIFVSQLASHTGNLQRTGNGSVMFIREESKSRNLFARERLIYQCQTKEILRTDPAYDELLNQMQGRFGETVALLRSLADFHLIALVPTSGRYVAGFGKAYDLSLPDGMPVPVMRGG